MLVGLTGFKSSGKNTVADYLTEKYGFEQLSFAKKLKDSAAALFDIDPSLWDELKNENTADITLRWGATGLVKDVSARTFLQRYGTESHRDIFGQNFWVDQVLNPLDREYYRQGRFVITDVRFPNEIQRVKECKGLIVNIQRPGLESGSHASEAAIDQNVIDYVLKNDGTISDLHKKIDQFIAELSLDALSPLD